MSREEYQQLFVQGIVVGGCVAAAVLTVLASVLGIAPRTLALAAPICWAISIAVYVAFLALVERMG